MSTAIFAKIFTPLLTEAFGRWLILWVAEIVVKSTKNTYDDKLVAKIKEVLNGKK